MIIYEIRWQDHLRGLCTKWTSSKAGVAKAKAVVRNYYRCQKAENGGMRDGHSDFGQFYDTAQHDIPSGKQGLVDWLNRFHTLDNG